MKKQAFQDPSLNAKKNTIEQLYKTYLSFSKNNDEEHANEMKKILLGAIDNYMAVMDSQLENPGSDSEHNELRSELYRWNNIIAELEQLDVPYVAPPRSMLNPGDWEVDYAKDKLSKGDNMLTELYKLAYDLDRKGLNSEAEEIEEVMKLMAKRVGLQIEDLISLANHFDALGDVELADSFDIMAKEAAKKDKEKMLKLKEKLKKAKEKEKAEKEKAKAKKLKEKAKAKKEKE